MMDLRHKNPEKMELPEALLISFSSFLLSALLIFCLAKCTMREKSYDEILKARMQNWEILGFGQRKEKKKKLKKGKVVGRENNVGSSQQRKLKESINENVKVFHAHGLSRSTPKSDELVEKKEPEDENRDKSLESGKIISLKTKLNEMKQDINTANVVQSVSCSTMKPKLLTEGLKKSKKRDVGNKAENHNGISLLKVKNFSTSHSGGGDGVYSEVNTELSPTADEQKNDESEISGSGNFENTGSHNSALKNCCRDMKINFDNLQKQNEIQKNKIERLQTAINEYNKQRHAETNQLHDDKNAERKKWMDENRKLKEENSMIKEAASMKDKQFKRVSTTLEDLQQKIGIMSSALEMNAKIYNSSENCRRNAESRAKQLEAQIKEMESSIEIGNGAVKRLSDVTQELTKTSTALERAMAEIEMLRMDSAAVKTLCSNCEKSKENIALIQYEKEAENKSNLLHLSEMKSALDEHIKEIELQLIEKEEILKRKEAVIAKMKDGEKLLKENTERLHHEKTESEAKLWQLETKHKDVLEQLNTVEERLNEKETEISQLKLNEKHLKDSLEQLNFDMKASDDSEFHTTNTSMSHYDDEAANFESMLNGDWSTRSLLAAQSNSEMVHLEVQPASRTSVHYHCDNEANFDIVDEDQRSTCSSAARPESAISQREVTVYTHIQEKAEWDFSQLVLDLDTKEAEINILQALLTQRETKLCAREKENAKLRDAFEKLQSEMNLKENVTGNKSQKESLLIDIKDSKQLQLELLDSNEQLRKSQTEIKRLEKELKILRGSTENLTDIDFAYRCVEKSLTNIVDEMEDKIKDLQDRLEVAEAEKLETFLQLSELKAAHEVVMCELLDLRHSLDSFKGETPGEANSPSSIHPVTKNEIQSQK